MDLRDSDCKEVDLSFGQGNLYIKITSIIARETATATVTLVVIRSKQPSQKYHLINFKVRAKLFLSHPQGVRSSLSQSHPVRKHISDYVKFASFCKP